VDSGDLPCGDPADLLHHPVRDGRPAPDPRRSLRPGSGFCRVELSGSVTRSHLLRTFGAARILGLAASGRLPHEVGDYAAVRTSQTPAACRCSIPMAVGSGSFVRHPAHPWRELGRSAVLFAQAARPAHASPPPNVRRCQERARKAGSPGVTACAAEWSCEPRRHALPTAHRLPP
jgi:hypothetical protein